MSRKKATLELQPPYYQTIEKEFFCIGGFTCPTCSGRGTIRDNSGKEPKIVDCPRCEGVGQLKVLMHLEWRPDRPTPLKDLQS